MDIFFISVGNMDGCELEDFFSPEVTTESVRDFLKGDT